jgi:hypothetical protein
VWPRPLALARRAVLLYDRVDFYRRPTAQGDLVLRRVAASRRGTRVVGAVGSAGAAAERRGPAVTEVPIGPSLPYDLS